MDRESFIYFFLSELQKTGLQYTTINQSVVRVSFDLSSDHIPNPMDLYFMFGKNELVHPVFCQIKGLGKFRESNKQNGLICCNIKNRESSFFHFYLDEYGAVIVEFTIYYSGDLFLPSEPKDYILEAVKTFRDSFPIFSLAEMGIVPKNQ